MSSDGILVTIGEKPSIHSYINLYPKANIILREGCISLVTSFIALEKNSAIEQ